VRVQRAPSAADQPQRPPIGIDVAPVAAAPGFSAYVDLDLTGLISGLADESEVAGEVIARLVSSCRHERVIDDETVLRVVKLTSDGLAGVQLGAAVDQSAYAIRSGLRSLSSTFAASTPHTLTVILSGTGVHAVGDWGWAGLGVVTLGRAVPTLVSTAKHGLGITQRSLARLGITLQSHPCPHGAVRALDAVARSLEPGTWPSGR
jgi:hypothetical protein